MLIEEISLSVDHCTRLWFPQKQNIKGDIQGRIINIITETESHSSEFRLSSNLVKLDSKFRKS